MEKKQYWDKHIISMSSKKEIDSYMGWLKDHPSIILKHSNSYIDGGVDFKCGKCNYTQTISPLDDVDMRQPINYMEWDCPICGSNSDSSLSHGRVNTMLIRLN